MGVLHSRKKITVLLVSVIVFLTVLTCSAYAGNSSFNVWHDIDPSRIQPEDFLGVIEISKNSKKKYEVDKDTGMIILDRILYTSTRYPANYGFIPRTLSEDGDPLDILVLSDESIDPLVLVKSHPIGVITMIDGGKMDEKVIAVPDADPTYNGITDISQLPSHISLEIQHFFRVYKQLEGKTTEVKDVQGSSVAKQIVKECMERYNNKYGNAK